jgi:hypothetical protein
MMQYTAVLRTRSFLRIREGEGVTIAANGQHGSVEVEFFTHYVDMSLGAAVATELIASVTGDANGLAPASAESLVLANRLSPVIALVANAAIDDFRLQLILDETAGSRKREFLQFAVPSPELARTSRIFPVAEAGEVYRALEAHPSRDRLYSAIVQYLLTMRNWNGDAILALSHAFIGMEAIKVVALDDELQRVSLTSAQLAQKWHVNVSQLRNEARLRLLFGNDATCHDSAHDASNGFEHGYETYDAVNVLSQQVRDKTAHYLRSAILRYLGLTPGTSQLLASAPYDSMRAVPDFGGVQGTVPGDFDLADAHERDFNVVSIATRPQKSYSQSRRHERCGDEYAAHVPRRQHGSLWALLCFWTELSRATDYN